MVKGVWTVQESFLVVVILQFILKRAQERVIQAMGRQRKGC